MKLIGNLLLVCVVLAAIKAAITGLLVAAGLVALLCLWRHPGQTLAATAAVAAALAFAAQPAWALAAITVVTLLSHLLCRG